MSLYTYKFLLPQFCVNKVHLCLSTHTNPCCHSGVSITFRLVYLHLLILYATVMSITFLSTPLHPDVLFLSQYSVSIFFSLPLYSSLLYDVDNVSYCTCTQTVHSVVVIRRCLYSSNSLLSKCCALPYRNFKS